MANMLRKWFREEYLKFKYKNNFNYKQLKRGSHRRRYILLNTPEHGNLGDQAISIAERQFLEKECKIKEVIEITHKCYVYNKKGISKFINSNDILLINGGGFIGSLWPNEEELVIDILTQFKDNKIVIFPQTVFFENSSYAELEKLRLLNTIKCCKNITIILRDQNSYELMYSLLGDTSKILVSPDIVTYLEIPQFQFNRKGVLFCLRNDKEKSISTSELNRIENILKKNKISIQYTDTVFRKTPTKIDREQTVYEKLKEFKDAELVITDRLHGMIFSAITNTPCIALDNISQKVSGGYQWFLELPYITCIKLDDITEPLVKKYLSYNNCLYNKKIFSQYYAQIKNVVMVS